MFEMIKNFLNFINQKNPKLISFNGRSFDMPLLMLRAMQYNLTCSAYFEAENKELNKNKNLKVADAGSSMSGSEYIFVYLGNNERKLPEI